MRIFISGFFSFFIIFGLFFGLKALEHEEFSIKHLTPENYNYKEAARCSNCMGAQNQFMPRAAGINLSSGSPKLNDNGWLASVHARSQSHENRVNTACAWCHAPTAEGATKDKKKAKPIPKGTWQGVTCGACHPGSLERNKRLSLIINYTPGTDPTKQKSYIFRDRKNGKEMNAQCRFCHHESHDLLIEAKQKMMKSGELRCIDCHMAAYALTNQHVERFHNFKVAKNLPFSCSGGMKRTMPCHKGVSKEWLKKKLPKVKGPRKEWSQ